MVPLEYQHLLNLVDSHKSSEILFDQLDGKGYWLLQQHGLCHHHMLANDFNTLEGVNLFEIDPSSMINCTNVTHVA